jgi:serpin B
MKSKKPTNRKVITEVAVAVACVVIGWMCLSAGNNCYAQPPIPAANITSVLFSGGSDNYTLTINGTGFGSLPSSVPFDGVTPYFRLFEAAQLGAGEWGYPGDANPLTYQSWSDTQIQISGLAAQPGDAVQIWVSNPTTGSSATWGGNIPGGSGNPQITSVNFSGSGANLQVQINGLGFGNAPAAMPFTGDLNQFLFADQRTHSGAGAFEAGGERWGHGQPDPITVKFQFWSDNKIIIDGFAGSYGQDNATIQNGDPIYIVIWKGSDTSQAGPQTAWGGFVSPNPAVATENEPGFPPGLQEVVRLARQGMSDDVIINMIKNSGKSYKFRSEDIIYLNNQGVSQSVISALLQTVSTGGSQLNQGLVAWYPFDGNANDVSGNGWTGTLWHSPSFVAGPVPGTRAIHLVGQGPFGKNGQYVTIPSVELSGLPAFSISLWAQIEGDTSGGSGEYFIWIGDDCPDLTRVVGIGYGFDGAGTYKLNFHAGNADINPPTSYSIQWHRYSLVYTDKVLTAYVDGQVVGTENASINSTAGDAGMGIHWWCNNPVGVSTRFTGSLADVRIYNRALSSAEIQQLAQPIRSQVPQMPVIVEPPVVPPAPFFASVTNTNSILSVPDEVVMANNNFAFDLYSRLANQPRNLFFSPYSIETALAMTWAGARGETADQMSKVLHLSGDAGDIHAGFAALIKNLNAGEQPAGDFLHDAELSGIPYQLFMANSLWCQQGYPFRDDFLKIVRDQYDAGLNQVDFVGATEPARQQINDWVAKQTQDKIENLIPRGGIDALTRLVLANAIYFKGHWRMEFDKSQTQAAPFYSNPSQTISVRTMNVQDRFGYTETENLQMLELPYFAEKMSMIVLLPKKVDGLPKLEQSLNAARMDQLLAQMQAREVNVFLPKFKLTSQFSLADTLHSMGMADAFSPQADFSGISSLPSLYIGAVLHKAYVDVDEEGTEAAAATAVIAVASAVEPPRPSPVIFRADHPFLFFIRHDQTGAILFMGRVTSP